MVSKIRLNGGSLQWLFPIIRKAEYNTDRYPSESMLSTVLASRLVFARYKVSLGWYVSTFSIPIEKLMSWSRHTVRMFPPVGELGEARETRVVSFIRRHTHTHRIARDKYLGADDDSDEVVWIGCP